jgi:hypothetical protein
MLEKRIDGWRSLVGFVLLPLGVIVFFTFLLGFAFVFREQYFALAYVVFVALFVRDFLLARKKDGRRLNLSHWAAVWMGTLSFFYTNLADRPVFVVNADGTVGLFTDHRMRAVAAATLVLAVMGAVLSRYYGKTRSLGRIAGGYLAAMVIFPLGQEYEIGYMLAALAVMFFVMALGDRVYCRLPSKKRPTNG